MNPTTDTLEIQIAKAKALLSQESRNAIDAVNWKQIIEGMGKKYSISQLEALETETELLLCGIVSTIDFPKELEARMKIPKVEVSMLLSEMDRLIFKKMQEELEKRLNNSNTDNKNVLDVNKALNFDLRFASLPKDIQESIAYSNWKEKLYDIARKYKINVEQMGILEDITVKVILNTIAGNQYEDAIRSKIDLGNDKIQEMVMEINENIFKNIKNVEEEGIKVVKNEKSNDEVPLPPYAKKKEEVVPIPSPVFSSPPAKGEMPEVQRGSSQSEIENIIANTNTKETDTYKEHGIEIISDEEKPTSNIITNKLFGNTTSKASVSDYSLPKMSGEPQSKPHDPYHEEI